MSIKLSGEIELDKVRCDRIASFWREDGRIWRDWQHHNTPVGAALQVRGASLVLAARCTSCLH